MSASHEKARRANAGLNFKIVHTRNGSTTCGHIEPARLRYFAGRVHALGERALFELLAELSAGASLTERLPVYAANDPAILAALGGVTLPCAVHFIGRAFE